MDTITWKQTLTDSDLAAIRELATLVDACDAVTTRLNWPALVGRSGDTANDLMAYHGGKLIGYLGLHQFISREIELTGMVHPDYRRGGLFTRLYNVARQAAAERQAESVLLICERVSSAGRAWVKAQGTPYEFSEYAMLLSEPAAALARPELLIRPARPDDQTRVGELTTICFGGNPAENGAIFANKLADPDRALFAAEIAGEFVGTIGVIFSEGYIFALAVRPEWRGRGYGRMLLQKAVRELAERNCPQIQLEVACANERALALYKACGFREQTVYDYYRQML